MNHDLEKYLKQASKGVWGKKKLEIISELRGSIESRIFMLEQQGHNNTEALKIALTEFGKPNEINAGLVKVHSMPKMFKAFVVAAMLSSLVIVNVNLSSAQMTAVYRLPSKPCIKNNESMVQQKNGFPTQCSGFWFSLKTLRTVLEPLGVSYSVQPTSDKNLTNRIFTFPGNNKLVIQQRQQVTLMQPNKPDSLLTVTNKDYVTGYEFFLALSKMTVPTTITGWDNPKIQIGTTSFTLGTTKKPIKGNLLSGLLFNEPLLYKYFPGRTKDEFLFFVNKPEDAVGTNNFSHYLKIANSVPDEIYLMLYRTKSSDYFYDDAGKPIDQELRVVSVSKVFKTGYLAYRNPVHNLEFATDTKELDQVGEKDNGKVMLMRFTGKLNANTKSFEVVPVNQIKIIKHPGR